MVKLVGAVYLLWLGHKALVSGDLVTFAPAAHKPLREVFRTGVMSNVLNPKPGLFVLAFLPQFVSAHRGSTTVQMLVLGAIFALMGAFASRQASWLKARPRVVRGVNTGAGLTLIAAGLSILALRQRSV